MSFSRPNSSEATGTRLRSKDFSPFSGMCVVCLDGCHGLCEVGRSAVRGRECIYPSPFGKITAGSQKDYPVDFSHLNIAGSCVGAIGVRPDPDEAFFSNVKLEVEMGEVRFKVPWFTTGLGSTLVARDNWEGVAIGSALFGTAVGVGENVCGVDPEAVFKNGQVLRSPEMERRVKLYRQWQRGGFGELIVQENVEDRRARVLEYVIDALGITFVEVKWGQGAKDIGGEIKVPSLDWARELKSRGYLVQPDPYAPEVEELYRRGSVREFERHSRLGMASVEDLVERVASLRKRGARRVSLKTGAYRPRDLALALKAASEAGVDLLVVDGAGGGTGMSPWRMMNEWGIPTIYLESLLYRYADKLRRMGKSVPAVAMAGGFVLEDQIFKGLALGAPFVRLIAMGRAPLTAAMVGKNIGRLALEGKLPPEYKAYGGELEEVFCYAASFVKEICGDEWSRVPPSALGVISYFERLSVGLKQLMAGARKFGVSYIDRSDLVCLTEEASRVTGLPYLMEMDEEEALSILESA